MLTPETASNNSDRFIQAAEVVIVAAKHLCPSIRGDVNGAILEHAFSFAHDFTKPIGRRKRSIREIRTALQEISQIDPLQITHVTEQVEKALFDVLEIPSEYNPNF